MRRVCLAAILLCLVALPALAAPPRLIPFQAYLTNAAGQPLSGDYRVTFSIYDAATGGTAKWVESHENTSVVGGQLSVLLGSQVSLDDPNNDGNLADAVSFAASEARFVGIKIGVDTSQEMVPRHQLVPAFHARFADEASDAAHADTADVATVAEGVEAGAVTVGMLAPSFSLPASNIAPNSITGAQISNSDADGLTSANIKDGTIALPDLDASLQSMVDRDKVFKTHTFVSNDIFVVPPDCAWLSVLAAAGGGGGGGGGGSNGSGAGGGGGGGGQGVQPISMIVPIATTGTSLNITVGGPGTAGTASTGSGGPGGLGGSTTISGPNLSLTFAGGVGGGGGVASGGSGGAGSAETWSLRREGAGGGAGGSGSPNGTGTGASGSPGTDSVWAAAGAAGSSGNAGTNGVGGGGGGGGAGLGGGGRGGWGKNVSGSGGLENGGSATGPGGGGGGGGGGANAGAAASGFPGGPGGGGFVTIGCLEQRAAAP